MAKQYKHNEESMKGVKEPECVASEPTPGQIIVNIEDLSMLNDIKKAISMIRGVVSVEKSKAMKSYEKARADVEAGRIESFDSLEDLKSYYNTL